MFHWPRLRAHALLLLSCCALGAACELDTPDENVRAATHDASTAASAGTGSHHAGQDDDAGSEGIIDAAAHGSFDKRALLKAAAECAIAQYDAFRAEAAKLVAATASWAATPDDAAHLDAARTQWRAAMTRWQRAELFSFGPAARSTEPGGRNLRDEIYVFPLGNTCVIDRQLVSGVYADSDFTSSLASARGLTALEYLLFHEGEGNACSSSSSINTEGSWDALIDELPQRRADYAKSVAVDVLAQVDALLQAWDAGGGNFIEAFVEAGDDTSVYDTQLQALDALNKALFYIELDTKELKLGTPLGIEPECANMPNPCPDAVESPHAHVSTLNLRQNLLGTRRLFEGCGAGYAGEGFDDWLASVDEDDLSQRMLTALEDAQAALDVLDVPLEDALRSDPAKVQAVYDALKRFTDLLKTEMVTVLMVTLPASAQGDND